MSLTQPPVITIVTVCYNAGKTIRDTIESVLAQSYPHIEYLIIDGQSTDGTLAVIDDYRKNVKLISEPDKGIYDAMNKALTKASGNWLYFLGADDVLIDKQVIETMVTHFTNADVVYYGNALFKNAQITYRILPDKWSLCYRNISHQTLFYPASVYKKFKYDLNYPIFADHVYNIGLFKSQVQFKHIDKTIAVYNDAGRSSYIKDEQYYKDLPRIVTQSLGVQYGLYVFVRIALFKMKSLLMRR